MAAGDAVANEPRLFVGQIPADCNEEELWPLFSPFGTVRNLHILRGPDSKPRGCAMVLYARWGQAEAAAEALDGTAALTAGQGRPLVVHFANPRKPPPGQPAELGLAPKKLFVGQVPRDITEDMLRPFFEPYGEIEHINILRTQRGQSAGCGFVQFRKWAQAENAMEVHNGKTRLGNSEVPLVVKFADAKRREQQPLQGLGYKRTSFFGDGKHLPDLSDFGMYQLGQQWPGLLPQGNPMVGNGLLNTPLALQQGMQSLIANAYPGSYPHGPGGYGIGDPGMMQQGLRHPGVALGGEGLMDSRGGLVTNRLQDTTLNASSTLGSQSTLGPSMSPDGLTGQLMTNTGSLGGSIGQSSLSRGLPLSHTGPSGSLGSLPVSTGDLAQQLSELNIASLGSQQAPSEGSSGTPFASQQPPPSSISAALADLTAPHMQSSAALHTLTGGVPYGAPDMQSLYLQSMVGDRVSGSGGLPGGAALMGNGSRPAGESGRPWGQKIGSNDKFNEWKLFVGQVPLEATEEGLWNLFAPIGQVLELYVLRNNNQKSRGCAFVTYASKELAEQAITQLNGRPMPSGKTLVVKYADRASANKTLHAAGNPLLNFYMQ